MPVWSFPIQGSFATKTLQILVFADENWFRISTQNGFILRQGVADLRSSTISIVEEVASASVINAGLVALFEIFRN